MSRQEVEEVLRDDQSEVEVSRSSGRPIIFGWTSAGERLAVVFEEMSEEPSIVYPVAAYPVPPPRLRKRKKR